ncbi:MAG: hypothetical protein E5X80_15100 [Mesorhizobium sp.]|uniref:hypothetical protein n=1 Tax=Mesorhizobium sp. TaxID=1871066 RepID=UPI0011FE4578|nr:hypothetical protein [Mesorhizobium sp.]TIO54364.1 MAG: hypothetical protein E5X78_04040 [Mesorhizobium sp.]TJV63927.1 MAG: hypothetical protein E5X80_15100 [Mesorhizobium sp.]
MKSPSSIIARVYLPDIRSFDSPICLFAANRVIVEFRSFHGTDLKTSLTTNDNMSTVACGIEVEQADNSWSLTNPDGTVVAMWAMFETRAEIARTSTPSNPHAGRTRSN